MDDKDGRVYAFTILICRVVITVVLNLVCTIVRRCAGTAIMSYGTKGLDLTEVRASTRVLLLNLP